MKSFITLALFLLAPAAGLFAQAPAVTPKPPADPQLYQTIKALDAQLFAAFNAADLAGTKQFFAPELEFYHDKDGLTNYAQFVASLDRLFHQAVRPQRTLIPESLEVYPIKDFGAVEIGLHRFCVVENGQTNCTVFKFIQVWHHHDGKWQVTRSISVGH
jgi:hypothetical protein